MSPRRLRLSLALPVAAALAVLVAACGGGQTHGHAVTTGPGHLARPVVYFYSSLPLRGSDAPAAGAIVAGIRLALWQAHGRAGDFSVRYRSLDDATAKANSWSAARTEGNARLVATNPDSILYIGDLDSGASELSAPILNLAGVTQISPGSPYIGLTDAVKGVTAPDDPQRFYPAPPQTFLRLFPSDAVETAAQLEALKQAGCTQIAIAHQAGRYQDGLATLLAAQARATGSNVVARIAIPSAAIRIPAAAVQLHRAGAQCIALMASPSSRAAALAMAFHEQLPHAPIIGVSQLCIRSWLATLPAVLGPVLTCTLPTLPVRSYPGGATLLAAYRRYRLHQGGPPASAYTLYGYEAAQLGIDAIASLGPNGDDRGDVLRTLFATRSRGGTVGDYGFTPTGDWTLAIYGLYHVGNMGRPAFSAALHPTRYIPLPSAT